MPHNRKWMILAAASVLVIGAVASGLASGESSSAQGSSQANQVDPALAGSFAILDRPKTPSDSLTPDRSADDGGHAGAVDSEARRTRTPAGRDVWVVPGSRGVCLVVSLGGPASFGSCKPTAWAQSGAFIGTAAYGPQLPEGETLIWGLIPDDTSVKVTMVNGASQSLSVNDNVLDASVEGVPESATVSGPQGTRSIRLLRVPGH